MEEVSNTRLLLTVELQELQGTLAVNIPPPPTDRIWCVEKEALVWPFVIVFCKWPSSYNLHSCCVLITQRLRLKLLNNVWLIVGTASELRLTWN